MCICEFVNWWSCDVVYLGGWGVVELCTFAFVEL